MHCSLPFPPKSLSSRARMYPVIVAYNVFEETFWKKYCIHKVNSKTNNMLASRKLFAYEQNKVDLTQTGCTLLAGVRPHNYGQEGN
jgi:hypothetical protein